MNLFQHSATFQASRAGVRKAAIRSDTDCTDWHGQQRPGIRKAALPCFVQIRGICVRRFFAVFGHPRPLIRRSHTGPSPETPRSTSVPGTEVLRGVSGEGPARVRWGYGGLRGREGTLFPQARDLPADAIAITALLPPPWSRCTFPELRGPSRGPSRTVCSRRTAELRRRRCSS